MCQSLVEMSHWFRKIGVHAQSEAKVVDKELPPLVDVFLREGVMVHYHENNSNCCLSFGDGILELNVAHDA